MKQFVLLMTLLLGGMAWSCKQGIDYQKSAETHNARIRAAYCTNNILEAEIYLLADIGTISEYESNHVKGFDFDMLKARDHERLFLIYSYLHETNRMSEEYEKSLEYINLSNRRQGLPPPLRISYDKFSQKVEQAEKNLNVRWKTNDFIQQ